MKSRLSPFGYAIVFVLFLAIIMIFSSPFLMENYKNGGNNKKAADKRDDVQERYYNPNSGKNSAPSADYYVNRDSYSRKTSSDAESRLYDRISELERIMQSSSYSQNLSDKYVCTIEGGLDERGIVVPIDQNNPPAKFVFACEYRK